mgnify:CR=1 FL=1|tara:strand:- start:232 stop:813 length:582 start_codon:yes stop_codon:yes gene_type:complete
MIFDASELTIKLINGSPAIFPTDTLPALSACPLNASKLWSLKKRPKRKPLILMGISIEVLIKFISSESREDALFMAEKYWPGALTMILPATGGLVDYLNPGAQSLGLRVPKSKMAMELLGKVGPLATTSVNISGKKPALSFDQASQIFPEIPLLGPLPWEEPSGFASTVISWHSKGAWKLIRKGTKIPIEARL